MDYSRLFVLLPSQMLSTAITIRHKLPLQSYVASRTNIVGISAWKYHNFCYKKFFAIFSKISKIFACHLLFLSFFFCCQSLLPKRRQEQISKLIEITVFHFQQYTIVRKMFLELTAFLFQHNKNRHPFGCLPLTILFHKNITLY